MNDYEEVRFGLIEGERLLKSNPQIVEACGTSERVVALFAEFDGFSRQYEEEHLSDTYA